jgi:hypothetical protein
VIRQYLYTSGDFRMVVSYAFEALRVFCELIESTIHNSLIQFNSSEYITVSVAPLQLFQLQTQSFIVQFRISTTNNFLLSLNIIRQITEGNAFLSGSLSNYYLKTAYDGYNVLTTSMDYSNCSCHLSSTCVKQFSIYDSSGNIRLFDVPGFYTGCYVIEALLQSTLQCFYNQICINELQSYLSSSLSMNITALDSSLPSQYFVNSTVEDLLNTLMIEEWNSTQLYDQYYDECQPIECTYTIETRNNVIYIITTMFGIVGGLITVLRCVVPQVVKLVIKKKELTQPVIGKS